jgi:hypothetical protein
MIMGDLLLFKTWSIFIGDLPISETDLFSRATCSFKIQKELQQLSILFWNLSIFMGDQHILKI